MSVQYIAYFRVSTQRQGQSGLGLEAQRSSVEAFCEAQGADVLEDFMEIESGTRLDRPMLIAALERCKATGSILLIAKLDRLARRVHFISGLLESGVNFTAVDMPNADRFMLHVYAAMAEEEARRISERTKNALAAAKRRGVKLGTNGVVLAIEAKTAADRFARATGPKIYHLRQFDGMSYRAIADFLNATQAIPNQRGGKWHVNSVHRLLKRYNQLLEASAAETAHMYRQASAP